MSKILISDAIGQSGINLLKSKGFEVTVSPDISLPDLVNSISGFDALIVRSRTKVTAEVIAKGIALKVIGRAGAGVDNIDLAAAREHHIPVVNAPGATSEAVAEHTIALLLSLARAIPSTTQELSQGKWGKSSYKAIELSGKTLGVVGFGHIGSRVARLGAAFGMKVLVVTRSVRGDMQKELDAIGGKFVALEALLKESDVVTIHVPATKDTQKLIGKKELSLMKPTAFFINTARATVVDERALIDALKEHRIAAAALDVFSTEPLPLDSELLDLPNALLTPHVASVSPEGYERASLMVCEDVARVLAGESATNPV